MQVRSWALATFAVALCVSLACNLGLQNDDDSAAEEVRVQPTFIDFGPSTAGVSDVEQFTIVNDTAGPVTLTTIRIESSGEAFRLVSSPDDGYVLEGESTKVINVEYYPPGESHDTGTVVVETDHGEYPTLEVGLEGCSVPGGCDDVTDDDDATGDDDDDDDDDDTVEPCGDISVSATSVDFGVVPLNQTATETLTIDNQGSDPLVIESVTVTGSSFGQSGLSTPATVSAGDSASLQLTFTPTASGVVSGFLEIESCDANQGSLHVALQGEGEESCEPNCMPDIEVTPLDIDFGDMTGGMGTGGFTVYNNGVDPLHLAGISMPSSAAGGAVAISSGDAFATIQPAGSEYFVVQWTPGELFPGMGCMDVLDEGSSFITIASDDPDEASVSVSVAGCCDGTGQSLNLCGLAGILDIFTCMGTCPDPVQGFLYCVVLGQNSC